MNYKKFNELHKKILSKIKPSKTAQVKLINTVDELLKNINLAIKNLNLDYKLEPILVGSVAKDTYLENPDIDIFIMFPPSTPLAELRKTGLGIGRAVLPKGEERYAEHPYISGKFERFDTDIVPCYKLTNIKDRMTAVDRTPFHTKFITEHLTLTQYDEVRLLKQFIKGIGAYGAEIEVQGFSGYLCELLILKYGTFLDLLRACVDWPSELVLMLNAGDRIPSNTNVLYHPKSVLPKKLSSKFKDDPLVFIDPVDRNRNVASALEPEKFNLFILGARTYLHEPQPVFFFPKPIEPLSIDELKKRLRSIPGTVLSIAFDTPEVVPDILHGQLRKSQRAIQKLLDSAGFGVKHTEYIVSRQTLILFELKTANLPDIETHIGPPEGHKNVREFLSKWNTSSSAVSKPYKKDGRWLVDIKREFTTPKDLLRAKILELSIGKHVTNIIRENVQIYQDINVIRKGLEKPLTQFLTHKHPWEY